MSRMRFIVTALIIGGIFFAFWWSGRPPSIEPGSVVVMKLQGSYEDAPGNPLTARLFGNAGLSLTSLLGELAKIERDDRVDTVVFRVRGLQLGWGRAEEIRDAIKRLSEKGRKTVAYLEFEGFGNGSYLVASGADRIVAAPGHRNPFVGLAAEYLYLGGFLEKFGVDVEYERIGRYKSAVESYAKKEMSEPAREMNVALLDSIEGRYRELISESRDLTPEALESIIQTAPTGGEQLKELGLIDGIAGWEEFISEWDKESRVSFNTYAAIPLEQLGFAPEVTFALIHGAGPVLVGEGRFGQGGSPVLASDTVSRAILAAAEDPEVDAILFRINSPGGSALASDIVWQAVEKAKAMGKPVVASFSDVAASGGYYVAAGADKIVAQPTTYTGSIGVFVIKPVIGGLLEKLGVGVEVMTRGPHADLLLSSKPMDEATRAVLKDDVKSVYDLFVDRVATGRSMKAEDVDALARGRVWTGAQAKENGLVDELGGLRVAAVEARKLVGVAEDAEAVIIQYPKPRPLAEELAELLGAASTQMSEPQLPLPEALGPLVALMRNLPEGVPLLVPPFLLEIR